MTMPALSDSDPSTVHPADAGIDSDRRSGDRRLSATAIFWRILGATSVCIGIVNAFIPLLPTTVFLLIGVWAWSKGAPEWRERLLAHPRYGPPLRHWENGRTITRRGKRLAVMGMALSFSVTLALAGVRPVTLAVGIGLAVLAAWLWSRPEPDARNLTP